MGFLCSQSPGIQAALRSGLTAEPEKQRERFKSVSPGLRLLGCCREWGEAVPDAPLFSSGSERSAAALECALASLELMHLLSATAQSRRGEKNALCPTSENQHARAPLTGAQAT